MSLSARLVAETNFGSPNGVTKQDANVRHLWHMTYAIGIPLGLLVLGLILWCVFRYRVKPGSTKRAAQFQYHIPIEAAYTLIPIVLVAVVFGYMYNAENKEDAVSKHPALIVNVQAFQWGWRFTYPNGHQEVGDVALPQNETVQINLRSDDVVHSFYVPEFLFQRDIIPGIKNDVDFNITKTGEWLGECTNICGTYHAYMKFRVKVMTDSDFNAWYAQQKPNSITNSGPSINKYSSDTGGES